MNVRVIVGCLVLIIILAILGPETCAALLSGMVGWFKDFLNSL